jgi:hypothetical protein
MALSIASWAEALIFHHRILSHCKPQVATSETLIRVSLDVNVYRLKVLLFSLVTAQVDLYHMHLSISEVINSFFWALLDRSLL